MLLSTQLMNLLTILFLSLSSASFAQEPVTTTPTPVPGFLSDFNYQVDQLKTLGEAQVLENFLTTDTRQHSICGNRAEMWSYELSKFKGVQTGKVFIHFTAQGEAKENADWAYHVAPYVIVNGQEMVLDPAFGVFNKRPVKMADWTNYFGKSKNCVLLDPSHNPEHLKLELYNLPSDDLTPLSNNIGTARQYPSTEGICYIRKVPMYYQWPSDVYGADLYRSGNSNYSKFDYENFDLQNVLSACQQAVSWSVQIKNSCSNYLDIKKTGPIRDFFNGVTSDSHP